MAIEPKDRLIFALDVPDEQTAKRYARMLKDHVWGFKVGLELYTAAGPNLVRDLTFMGYNVFLDLKLYDIPTTVVRTLKIIDKMDVTMTTIHARREQMMAARDADLKVGVIGVTVLTSVKEDSLPQGLSTVVLAGQRANQAKLADIRGIVCAGTEVAVIRNQLGPDQIIITPGTRSRGEEVHDQKRVVTPGEAIRAGSDMLVIGRQVRDADDPVAAMEAIAGEIA